MANAADELLGRYDRQTDKPSVLAASMQNACTLASMDKGPCVLSSVVLTDRPWHIPNRVTIMYNVDMAMSTTAECTATAACHSVRTNDCCVQEVLN